MTLQETLQTIEPVNKTLIAASQSRWDSIAKPLHSLGLLEKYVAQLCGIRGTLCADIKKPCVVVMCADNGVVAQGVTQTSQEVTAAVTKNLTTGNTSVCCMAHASGVDVIPVDVGVACDLAIPGLWQHKVAYGTKDMTLEPAMTYGQAVEAIEVGIHMVEELAQKGYDFFATGEMGIGNTTTSSALTAVLLHKSAAEVTGRGAGLSSEGLVRKVLAIDRAIEMNEPEKEDALDCLYKVGGLDIAGLVGVFLGGAALHLPVMIDGFISATAALCAARMCPAAKDYMIPSHVSNEPAGHMLMEALSLQPFLTCGMCLGEGTGAVAALPVLQMGLAVYQEMCTFDDVQIEAYVELK